MNTGFETAEQLLRNVQAPDYERWMLATKGRFFDCCEKGMFLNLVQSTRFGSVLELGCGTGRITETVAPRVGNITALDFSSASLRVLQAKKIGNVNGLMANVCEGLPFASGSFPLVIACQILQHLSEKDLLAVLRECRRVLEPDGKLVFAAYNRDYFRYCTSEEIAENGLYSKRFSKAYVQYLAATSGFQLRGLKYYKALPSRLGDLALRQGLALPLDRLICALPGVGARLAGYMFPVLVPA